MPPPVRHAPRIAPLPLPVMLTAPHRLLATLRLMQDRPQIWHVKRLRWLVLQLQLPARL